MPEQFLYRQPHWCRETLTEDDARFLYDLVLDVRPDVAVEVGVDSGCASVHILSAMATYRQKALGDVWLHGFDVAEWCDADASKTTGAAVAELTPELRSHYRLMIGDVPMAQRMLTGLHATFASIDGDRLHGWAATDLAGLLPVLVPGAWIALHDIRLSSFERWNGRGHEIGHLFDQWPGDKRRGGTEGNIGAIRLPENLDDVTRWLSRTFGPYSRPTAADRADRAPAPSALMCSAPETTFGPRA